MMRHTKKWEKPTHCQETMQSTEQDSEMTHMLEQTELEITMICMSKILVEKINNMHK